MKNIFLFGTVASILICTPSFGQDYTAQVKKQLSLVKAAGQSGGWQETHEDKFDNLSQGGANAFTVTLKKGMTYKIIGVCDNDCSDLDMTLYDENNNEISKDQKSDSMPMVEASPKWTGKFYLRTRMYACSNSPCFYGITILGR